MGTLLRMLDESESSVQDDTGRVASAAELADDGRRVGAWLRSNGAAPGDRVAIQVHNRLDHVRMLAGCAAAGVVAVSVNTRFGVAEADDLVRRSGAGAKLESLDDAWCTHAPIEPVGGADDPFVVFTTSGTTSAPKMVLHTQRSIVEHAADVATGFPYHSDDVVLVAMPLCGTFGLTSLTAALTAGSRVLLTDFEVARTGRLIADERVTCTNGSDDMFHRLIEFGADVGSLRLAGYARFNSSLDGIVDRAHDRGAVVTGLYGMSEVQALFALRDSNGDCAERARAGGTIVSPRAGYRIVDGELQLRGPSLFAGYLAEGGDGIDAALTAEHHDAGWFRTGDLAETDDDRTFHYVARMGDVLRLGGFLVSPGEIESVLAGLAGVTGIQVVAVDRPDGTRPVAFVTVAPGASVDETAAIDRCRDRLARYKVPVRVLTVEEFPTTQSANGTKIQKARLRVLAEAALGG